MKVLLAVEPGQVSESAIRLISKLQFPAGSELVLQHVVAVPHDLTGLLKAGLLKINPLIKAVEREGREQGHQFVARVERRLEGRFGGRVQLMVTRGFPGEEILQVIGEHKIALAVLGTRGLSNTRPYFLGSVSQRVLQEAPCSVLVARPVPPNRRQAEGMTVLFATDGSSDATAAADFLKSIRLPTPSRLTILHVVRGGVTQTEPVRTTHRVQQPEWLRLSEELIKIRGREGRNLLQKTQAGFKNAGLHVVVRLAFGKEAEEILKAAKQIQADLIVVGRKGMTGLRRLFLGSVSQQVVQGAACSVMVIRNKRLARVPEITK